MCCGSRTVRTKLHKSEHVKGHSGVKVEHVQGYSEVQVEQDQGVCSIS